MSKIELDKSQKDHLVVQLQRYFDDELEVELGQFDADFLLDFISQHMGRIFYNQGVYDAQAVLDSKIESVQEAILQLEK